MRRAMNRIFLAILALFAGIAAQVVPAEARVRGETEIGAVQNQKAAARVATAVQIAASFLPTSGFESVSPRTPSCPDAGSVAVLTVLIGPDRALE
jgi:hypothetical protein